METQQLRRLATATMTGEELRQWGARAQDPLAAASNRTAFVATARSEVDVARIARVERPGRIAQIEGIDQIGGGRDAHGWFPSTILSDRTNEEKTSPRDGSSQRG